MIENLKFPYTAEEFKKKMKKTFHVSIEGGDGSGKKTQADRLRKYFEEKGLNVLLISFPCYEEESSLLAKAYLTGKFGDDNPKVASVCFATDRFIYFQKHKEEIENADVVIYDRYILSNIIHQSRYLEDEEREAFIKWVLDLEYGVFNLPKEDISIFLNMPPECSLKLINGRAQKGVSGDILENEKEVFSAWKNAMKVVEELGMEKVDCAKDGKIKDIETIFQEVCELINSKIERG